VGHVLPARHCDGRPSGDRNEDAPTRASLDTPQGRDAARRNLDRLARRARVRPVTFTEAERRVPPLGRGDPRGPYRPGDTETESGPAREGCRGKVDDKLDVPRQHTPAAQRPDRTLGCVPGDLGDGVREADLPLVSAAVRPRWESCARLRRPRRGKDGDLWERGRRTATTSIGARGRLPDEERPRGSGPFSLEKTRLRGSLGVAFLYLKGPTRRTGTGFLRRAACNRTRSHAFQRQEGGLSLDTGKRFDTRRL